MSAPRRTPPDLETRPPAGPARAARRWAPIALGTLCVGVVAQRAGVPAAWLIAGLVVGLAVALRAHDPPPLPTLPLVAAQAVIGAALGAQVQREVLADVWRDLAAVVGVSLGTLALSVVAGLLLARFSALDRPTAVLGMLAGAAEGVVAASREASADARLVAVIQYLRLLLVVASVPVLVTALFETGTGSAAPGDPATPAVGMLWFALIAVVGAVGARRLRVPIGVLVGPLALAALAAGLGLPVLAPAPVAAAALGVIGLSVGLTFEMRTLRQAGRLLPAILAALLLLIAGSGALAVVFAQATGSDGLTAYLATSPGGLSTVLATAYDTGATTAFVLAVQLTRFMIMVVAGPALARLWTPDRTAP